MDNEIIASTVELLKIVKDKIRSDSDVAWSGFSSPSEFRFLIDTYIYQVKHGDITVFQELNHAFAPTGMLQEHSLSNGWGNEFIVLSKRFDKLYKEAMIDAILPHIPDEL